MENAIVKVIVDAPFSEPLDYLNQEELDLVVGTRCMVRLGRRTTVGVVVGFAGQSEIEASKLKPVLGTIDDVAPLGESWMRLTHFASAYYQSAWGRVALMALPKFFRTAPNTAHERALLKLREAPKVPKVTETPAVELNDEQKHVVEEFSKHRNFHVGALFGVTGSGKTEVYLQLIEKTLSEDPKAQVLLMVPEINLTPQLVKRVRDRFPQEGVVMWHSAMAESKKAGAWLQMHEGRSRIMVGTRLTVFASIPNLRLIVVDEEHDASFKSMENVRYSSRDLAVKRAQIHDIPILLGSATPSFETMQKCMNGLYSLYRLKNRARSSAKLPEWTLVDTKQDPEVEGLSSKTKELITETLEKGFQVLIFLNRRGYAPVVICNGCGWQSTCPHCSTFAVFHRTTGRLTCHHCGWSIPLPTYCPKCGAAELLPVGRGTQRIEEEIENTWPEAKVIRLDQDSTRRRGSAEAGLKKVHDGEVDIVLGTQMLAKGHDFQRIALVVILNTDAQLLSPDLRAKERLFSLLLQVSGRAGRGDIGGRVVLQTKYPDDPFFEHLMRADYEAFSRSEMEDRKSCAMPPFSAQALMVAEGRDITEVLGFLGRAKNYLQGRCTPGVRIYDPVPQSIVRIQDVDRAQLLIEADSKRELQYFLASVHPDLLRVKTKFSWYIDVDPVSI